ncbi:hypothetical protein JQ580_00120 [Bradyrhizobium japonicum]|uniref:hypothetical protein n=1 Tax=Bradyrhizobium japonicum TaxID=375 RepID=UPI001BA64489|nr:hypothetical protein [Bradyrhizobium japonicum]MBR0989120.1 hypothetical protein [Bradyrhizobium japonicum]
MTTEQYERLRRSKRIYHQHLRAVETAIARANGRATATIDDVATAQLALESVYNAIHNGADPYGLKRK